MPSGVFIGTFDPLHGAHIGQLLRANTFLPLSHVHICVNKNPSHKPNVSTWQHRTTMANLTLNSFDLPFDYSVLATTTPNAEELPVEVDYKIVGIDALIDDLRNPHRWQFATKWPMIVLSIPGIEREILDDTLATLPLETQQKISFLYVGEIDAPMMNYDFDKQEFVSHIIHSTHLREGGSRSFIPADVREYINTHQLYN